MTGNDDSKPFFFVQPKQCFPDFCNSFRVKPVNRFIQYEKIGFPHKSHSNAEPLLHPQREVSHFLFSYIFQTNNTQNIFNVTGAVQAHTDTFQFQIIISGHIRVKPRCFNQYPNAGDHLVSLCAVIPEKGNIPAGRFRKAANHFQKCCLASAVFSNQTINFTLPDMQANIINSCLPFEFLR